MELSNLVVDIASQIKEKNDLIKIKKAEIKKHIESNLTEDQFADLKTIDDLDKKIENKKKEIEAQSNAKEISEKAKLSSLIIPALPTQQIKDLLNETISDLSNEAIELTRKHIEKCMDDKGETWISDGLKYIKNDSCPFCAKSIEKNNLIEAYQSYFNEAYVKLKTDIANLENEIESVLFSAEKLLQTQKVISSNASLVEFWGKIVNTDFASIDFDNVKEIWNGLKKSLKQHLLKKASSPLDKIELDSTLEFLIQEFSKIQEEITGYNERIDLVNKLIDDRKMQATKGNIVVLKNELAVLNDVKKRFLPEVNKLCEEFKTLKTDKSNLEAEKTSKKDELDKYSKNIFQKYETSINQYLQKFGAEFKIVEAEHCYPSGLPSSKYLISINNQSIDLGNSNTPLDVPSFKNTLSDGDKSTLAFAFFLSKLEHDSKIAQKIIVFDDPISSLDKHRKFCTQQQIVNWASRARQVIVMSHEPGFLYEIWKKCEQENIPTNALVIQRVNSKDSSITSWNIEKENLEEYIKLYYEMDCYLEKGATSDSECRLIADHIRILLEHHLKYKFPKEFMECKMLGVILHKVQLSTSVDVISALKPYQKELSEINDYALRYHHPTDSSEPINDGELKTWVTRAMNIIHGTYKP